MSTVKKTNENLTAPTAVSHDILLWNAPSQKPFSKTATVKLKKSNKCKKRFIQVL